jgi:alkylation response protein AidB-like acyl-CoA dehydrogenase
VRGVSRQLLAGLDTARAYPGAFVKALTDAGYLAALIPEEYVAPISTNLILAYVAEHMLGLPRSY